LSFGYFVDLCAVASGVDYVGVFSFDTKVFVCLGEFVEEVVGVSGFLVDGFGFFDEAL
jgi:hypothetical protein